MRIERLVVEGFGPFAARQDVDFRGLHAAGLFLITGRTGSGKSSILDAICFALYGSAPRYDGGRGRVRSDHVGPEAPTRVQLEFVVAGDRWRVARSPEYERPKRRGEGMTVQKEVAELERWDGTGWTGVAARAVDVAEQLEPLLQLTRSQFLQVILLAQGRFQEFLRARSEDRLALLRTLFGTERFARFEAEITERAKALEASVGRAAGEVAADLRRLAELAGVEVPEAAGAPWAVSATARLADLAALAAHDEAAAQAALDVADAAAAAAIAVADLQRRRAAARAELGLLESEAPAVEGARVRLAEALRVLPVLATIDASSRATAELGSADAAARAAAEAVGAPVADPAGEVAALDTALGALEAALADERALPALEEAVGTARTARDRADAELAAGREAADAIPHRRRVVYGHRTTALTAATLEADAARDLEQAQRTADAAARAEVLTASCGAADATLLGAVDAEQRAGSVVRTLVAARIAGAAGILATALRPGVPCPVCGSAAHPDPAAAADPVDDEAVERAEAAQAAAVRARETASQRAGTLRQELAAARAVAQGATEEQAAARVLTAVAHVDAADAARAEVGRLDAELAGLDEREAAVATAVQAASVTAATTADALARVADRHDGAVARVTAARGTTPSVAARVASIAARRHLVRTLETATGDAADARRRAGEAQTLLARALEGIGVPDARAARAAALPEAGRGELQSRIEAHAARRSAAEAQLAEHAVAAAATTPADVAGTAEAKSAALAARVAAADRRADARGRAERAAAVATAVQRADAAVADDREQLRVLAPLAATVRGDGANDKRMRLESYVLAARLEQIVAAANARLARMTDGRFALRHDDAVGYRNVRSGLGLEVLDEHTGRARPIASLSGGETFLASLALALGLAEVVSAEAGGVRLETLFVDEGFGSLDRETLDTAMATLDSLQAGGRVVGLISHVEAMQEDVPAGLHVERAPDGTSRVRLRTGVSASA